MLPEKYRRLWRRRLRRRPLLPFLLAATLAVDVLIAASIDFRRDTLATVAGCGFLLAQVGLMAAWSLHSPRWVAQRLLIGLGVSVVLGWWFLGNDADNLDWFVTFVLAIDVLILSVLFRFRRKNLLQPRLGRYGIGGLLSWTTIAAVAIAALRSVDWSQTAEVLQLHEVWSGVFLDAFIIALTLTVASRGRSSLSTVVLVGVVSTLLLFGRLALSRIVQMGVVYYMNRDLVESAHIYIAATTIYQLTFVATLLVWVLGVRFQSSHRRQHAESTMKPEAVAEGTESIDLTA